MKKQKAKKYLKILKYQKKVFEGESLNPKFVCKLSKNNFQSRKQQPLLMDGQP